MSTEQFYWRETVLVIGGVALVALLQADLETPEASHVIRTWIVHGLFGAIYALIGSATAYMAVTRLRDSQKPGRRNAH